MMCRAFAIFPRPLCRAATTLSARRSVRGICIAPGRRRTCGSCRMPATRHSNRAILTSLCSRPIDTVAVRGSRRKLVSELAYIGLARATDAREIAEMSRDLIEQGLTWSWTPARVQHFISGPESSVVVARREQRIAAFGIMHFGDDVAHLNLLAVAPEHRRQGLGSLLMDWLTRTAVEAGVFRINLELRTHNDAARVFYARLGFDQLGVVQGYYQGREAALRMSRHLAKT